MTTNRDNKELIYSSYKTIIKHIIKCIIFNDKSLLWIYLNKRITKKITIIYLFLLLLPIKSLTAEVYFFNIEFIIGGLILSFIYYFLLYLLIPIKKVSFFGLIRVFFSIEIINVLMAFSLFFKGTGLIILYSIIIGWYFTLSVFVVYIITKIPYRKAILIVSIAFVLTNFIPAMFNN